MIRKAIEKVGLSDFGPIEQGVLRGRSLLWIGWKDKIEGALVTNIQVVAGERVCVIVAYASGNMKDWLHLLERIERYAADEKCKCVRIFGREGWLRALTGYQKKAIVIERPCNER